MTPQFPGRPTTLAATIALAFALGGCASISAPGAPDGGTSDDATPPAPTPAAMDLAPPAPTSNPAAARFVLPGIANNGAAIGSVVVTNPLAPRTLDLTERPDDVWDRIRTGFGIPNIDTPLVAEQQAWYLSHPDYLRRAVDRSSLYLFHVVEELNKRGMPTELALLPFVESAYNPMAYSRAHASGMWQFIPGTGRDYKLKQDWWRDERRDVIASTDAALSYLQTIYELHGDWHLALASYNWGEGSVKRAIERNQAVGLPTDYLSLQMPDETRNYVPKLQALKNIIANPAAFGVTLPRIGNEPYFVVVPRSRDIDMRTAARLANMSIEDFRALNPSFNRPVIAGASNTALLVPADRADDFRTGLAANGPLATWQAHIVQRHETIEKIAARYGMTAAALREVNGLPPHAQVRPGHGLLVQKKGEGDVNLRFASFSPPSAIQLELADASTVRFKRGDTLASIARRHGMTTAELKSLNHLKSDKVAIGRSLEVRPTPAKLVTVKATAGSATSTKTAHSGSKHASRHAAPRRQIARR
jgi:membrane-bound lytic murein transglycosylase D